MASTYSTNLAIELIGTGDQAGTWGVTTNSNLGTLIEQAISGYVTQAVATGTDTTITIPNGATGVARNMYIELTGTGGTNTNLIVPSNKKLYFIFNNSTGAVTVKVTGQTGVSVPQGKKMILVSNGTDIVNGVNYIADFGTNSFTVTNLTASSATITNLIATTASISDASATVLRASSATLTHLSATSASITNLALTSLTISSLNITNVSVASATVSSNLVLSGGTANGVLYLNGSKVATSGTGLEFDGTNFGVGTGGNTINHRSVIYRAGANAVYHQVANGSTGLASSNGIRLGLTSGGTGELYSPTALISYIDNAEQMRLTSTGLGIGTSSPSQKLDVRGNMYMAATNARIYIDNGGVGGASVQIGASGTSHGYVGTDGSFPLVFQPNNSEKMRLTDSGNLGIGTSSPAAKLHVVGDSLSNTFKLIANTTVSGSDATIFRPADNTMAFSTNGAERARIDSSGNVGIGTSSPAFKLQVTGTQRIEKSGAGYEAAMLSFSTLSETGAIYRMGMASGGAFIIGRSDTATTNLTLDVSGNFGIGTSSPGAKLDVRGNATFTGNATARQTADFTNTGGQLYVGAESSAGGAVFTGSSAYAGILGTNTNTVLQLATNGSVRATLDTSGNLGIGTASPTSGFRLDVVGADFRVSDVASDDGVEIGWSAGGNSGFVQAYDRNASAFRNLVLNNAATLDTSGNLGLGVTPSASSVKTFEVGAVGNTLTGFGLGDVALMSNVYYDGAFKYAGSNLATRYRQQDGTHAWSVAASGTAGNTISFTQALTLTANRNLLVNTTTENSGNGGLKVNGQFALAASQGVTASATVDNNAYYVVCYSLSGTCTLTLPTPANNTGRLLNIVVQSAQQVVSASSNVTKITDGSLTTEILPATAGKWAQLWCDGTYWNIIATNV